MKRRHNRGRLEQKAAILRTVMEGADTVMSIVGLGGLIHARFRIYSKELIADGLLRATKTELRTVHGPRMAYSITQEGAYALAQFEVARKLFDPGVIE